MRFGYRVRDEKGRLISGIWEADHKNTAIASLLSKNYYVVSFKELRPAKVQGHFNINLSRPRKVSDEDLVVFTRQLSIMLASGLPVIRCLKIMEEQASNPGLKEAVLSLQQDIENGLSLGEAFSRQSSVFSRVYISLLKAGETAGSLDTVLSKLSYHLEKEREFNAKLKSASIYPLFISVLAVFVVISIITLVMPRFISVFESSGVQLPLPTRLLMEISSFLQTRGLFIFVGLIGLVSLIRWGKGTKEGMLIYDTILLHLPIVGESIRRLAVARFARTLGILSRSGINIVQALEVVEGIVGNVVIGRAISGACRSIKEGASISSPLRTSGIFDPLVTHMIAVGEETGRLEEVLIHLSNYYEGELFSTLDSLIAVIEPLLILLVALVIGGVVIAILYPMFDMINLVGI